VSKRHFVIFGSVCRIFAYVITAPVFETGAYANSTTLASGLKFNFIFALPLSQARRLKSAD